MKAREGTRPPLSADSGKFTGLYSLVSRRRSRRDLAARADRTGKRLESSYNSDYGIHTQSGIGWLFFLFTQYS